MMESQIIELFGRRTFDLATIVAAGTKSEVVARHVPVEGYGQAVVLLRIHANAMGASRTATLRCISEAPTDQDPDQDFLLDTDAASLEVTSATTVGTLLKVGLTPDFSYCLRFLVDLFNGSGSGSGGGTIELSADLVLRRGITRPSTHKETFVYAPGVGDTAYYVPFRTATESTTIGVRQTLIAPVAGEVERVLIWCEGGGGSTIVGFHKNGSATATATVTKTLLAATMTEFVFPPTARFKANERLHIKVSPATGEDPGNTNGTVVLKLDTDFVATS